jgi:hypothetical protein
MVNIDIDIDIYIDIDICIMIASEFDLKQQIMHIYQS